MRTTRPQSVPGRRASESTEGWWLREFAAAAGWACLPAPPRSSRVLVATPLLGSSEIGGNSTTAHFDAGFAGNGGRRDGRRRRALPLQPSRRVFLRTGSTCLYARRGGKQEGAGKQRDGEPGSPPRRVHQGTKRRLAWMLPQPRQPRDPPIWSGPCETVDLAVAHRACAAPAHPPVRRHSAPERPPSRASRKGREHPSFTNSQECEGGLLPPGKK